MLIVQVRKKASFGLRAFNACLSQLRAFVVVIHVRYKISNFYLINSKESKVKLEKEADFVMRMQFVFAAYHSKCKSKL